MNLARVFKERVCPACGFKLDFEPWAEGQQAERNCPCCGIAFGYDDQDPARRETVYREWRERWIENGRRWWSKDGPPVDYNPPWQLARLEHLEGSR